MAKAIKTPAHLQDEAFMAGLVRFTAKSMETHTPVPFGALIVNSKSGQVLMQALNAVAAENDPSSHAEVRTVRKAAKKLARTQQTRSLAGYTMYTTCEPCPMCMANALWAGLDRVVYGATIADANKHCKQIQISARELTRRSDMTCIVDGPVLRAECYALFTHPNMLKVFASWSTDSRRLAKSASKKSAGKTSTRTAKGESMTESNIAGISALVADPTRVITNPQTVQRLSRDFYWYSPILKKQLENKTAELAVQPVNVDEIIAILTYCNQHEIPVTARGAGTGNYGQAIPLEGGVVLDLAKMDALEEITSNGVAVCGPGLRLGVLENTAREVGWELRCYPSTVVKASVGGFLGGGSGGIGSIAHGGLRDFDTVCAVEVVTMEDPPRVVLHQGKAIHDVLHAWGTNGIITKVWLALTPAVEWAQCAVAFDTFDQAFTFSEQIAVGDAWTKRLITTFEWPIPSCFTPVAQVTRDGKALIFFMIAAAQLEALQQAATDAGGEITLAAPWTGLRTLPLLSDYTWNHTTLWAIKQDDSFTYLQCGFDLAKARDQFARLKQTFGNEILFHIEWMKNGAGIIIPGSIPLVRFTTEERLNEMVDFCRAIGVGVANPHINNVEGGGRYREDNVQLLTKYKYDPKGLLNPGKMVTFKRVMIPTEAKEPVTA